MEYLDPKNKFVFRKIFGNYPEILKSFLKAFLPLTKEQVIVHIAYLPSNTGGNSFILDNPIISVECLNNFNEIFFVDITIYETDIVKYCIDINYPKPDNPVLCINQPHFESNLQKSVHLYSINIFLESVEHVGPYEFTQKPILRNYRETLYNHYSIICTKDDNQIAGLEMIFIELSEYFVRPSFDNPLRSPWIYFLCDSSPESVADFDPAIGKAVRLLQIENYTQDELIQYQNSKSGSENKKHIYSDAISDAFNQGVKHGMTTRQKAENVTSQQIQNNTESKINSIRRRMFDKGLSNEEIAHILNMSLREVKKKRRIYDLLNDLGTK